jgi:uncharacterized membrane protein (UPF0127 family)
MKAPGLENLPQFGDVEAHSIRLRLARSFHVVIRSIALIFIAVVLTWLPTAPLPAGAQQLATSEVVIVSGGDRHKFKVEMAATPAERERGLMFRQQLDADSGMLFDFKVAQEVAFWMKNTFIPLDMLFIAPDGRIVRITKRTIPKSLTANASGAPVRAVLEVNGGTTSRLGIQPGDRVVHPIFEN